MDSFKMFKGLKKIGFLEEYQKDIIKRGNGFNLSSFVKSKNINVLEYKNWAAYSYNIDDNLNTTQIMEFTKDPYNMLYVPGSSIKGALRTAYENYYFSFFETKSRCEKIKAAVNGNNYRKDLGNEDRGAKESAFNKLELKDTNPKDAVNDIFRGIRISDSKPISTENLILCHKYDIKPNNISKKLMIQRECIKPGTKIEFNIEIIPEYFKIKKEEKENFETAIYNFVNKSYLMQKNYFLSKFPNVQNENSSENFIYIGGGSGFVSKTILHSIFRKDEKECVQIISKILAKNFPKDSKNKDDFKNYGVSPHTRKCTIYNKERYDFGLCKLNLTKIN